MSDGLDILILDDGELDDLVRVLRSLDVEFTHLRGGEVGEGLEPPRDLLVVTPRRAAAVRSGEPPGARAGRPVRIIYAQEDSNAMRQMLRRQGFDLLVRRPTHPEVWRLLVRRALYQGGERRAESRVAIASDVTVSGVQPGGRASALLVEMSARGCRILSSESVAVGDRIEIEISGSPIQRESLCVAGTVLRVADEPDDAGGTRHRAAIQFEPELAGENRQLLDLLLEAWSSGCEWATSEGVAVDFSATGEERRHQPRASFEGNVAADRAGESLILMGRDLSAGGMRVERLPDLCVGDRFELSIYPPASTEPLRLRARVVRDDGERGFALAFEDVSDAAAVDLEKLVACLPDVEPLQATETDGLGSVISELRPMEGPER